MKKKTTVANGWAEHFDKEISRLELKAADPANAHFEEIPVPPKEFFDLWLKTPLFPIQLDIVEKMFTKDFKGINRDLSEFILALGKGAGKDFLTTRLLVYTCYWLLCCKSPQQYLEIGEGTPIDIVNTCFNQNSARDIFFSQFCDVLKMTINPATGMNWFEEHGMDLRQGHSIQNSYVKFPKNINAYSLNSVSYAGEGKCILIGILDEIAEFKFSKARQLYTKISSTGLSRFPTFYKVILISYFRDEFDFMVTHYNEVDTYSLELQQRIFRLKKATWEVNLNRKREEFKHAYEANPEGSALLYENKLPDLSNTRFIKDFEKVLKNVNYDRNPIIKELEEDELVGITNDINQELFQPYFAPGMTKELYDLMQEYDNAPTEQLEKRIELERSKHEDAPYYIHLDLAKGTVDFAGFALVHPYENTPGHRKVYIDLALEIKPLDKEINFEEIRKFILKLQDTGFYIAKVTMDQFSSIHFIQLMEAAGIPCELKSVDRSPEAYSTLKDLLYQGSVDLYFHPTLLREIKELQKEGDKIDHPKESMERLRFEGKREGSKDVADALAGAVHEAISGESGAEPGISCPEPEDQGQRIEERLGLK